MTSSSQSNGQFPQSPPWLPPTLATSPFRWRQQIVDGISNLSEPSFIWNTVDASWLQLQLRAVACKVCKSQHAGPWTERYRLYVLVKGEGFGNLSLPMLKRFTPQLLNNSFVSMTRWGGLQMWHGLAATFSAFQSERCWSLSEISLAHDIYTHSVTRNCQHTLCAQPPFVITFFCF